MCTSRASRSRSRNKPLSLSERNDFMKNFKGRTAVITGAGSGFGLEASRIAARLGMNIVMADVQQDALDKAVAEISALGAAVLPLRPHLSNAAAVEALRPVTSARFGGPN